MSDDEAIEQLVNDLGEVYREWPEYLIRETDDGFMAFTRVGETIMGTRDLPSPSAAFGELVAVVRQWKNERGLK